MDEITINIPIVFDTTYPIKAQIDPKWIFTDIIYDELNTIYIACVDDNCQYVAKLIKINNDYDEPGCYTAFDKVRNELVISKLMSDNGIGPTIYDMSINDTEAIMIMDRYDGTLNDLLWSYQLDKTIPLDEILNDLANLINKMHSLNIAHIDLHMGNILYIRSGKIIISDFGQSLCTNSKELKDDDWRSFEGIKRLYNGIKQEGEIIEKDYLSDVYFELTPPTLYNFVFMWNSKPCEW